MASGDSSKVWSAFSLVAVLGAAAATKKVLHTSWKAATGKTPPANPADREVGWGEAVAWSVAAGVGVGVARLISERVAARGWELAVGSPPPGVRTD